MGNLKLIFALEFVNVTIDVDTLTTGQFSRASHGVVMDMAPLERVFPGALGAERAKISCSSP